MALIIKGDMPKACNWFDENGKHRFCMENAFCDCRLYTRDKRPSDCPILGEIPDEHGRLIDADKMELDLRASVANLIEKYPDVKNIFSEYERVVIGIINKTPTVVEASK